MALDNRPARSLTSREIAKIIAGLIGALAAWCDPSEIDKAFEHFHDNAKTYSYEWRRIHEQVNKGE